MAASSQPGQNCDVFLNFRGEDICNNFEGHLYKALDRASISTYMDCKELRKGEGIWPSITRSIQELHIAVVIFSKSYASLPWCLEEPREDIRVPEDE